MPGLDGIEATRRIVAASPHIAVLVLTMYDDDASVFAAMRAGARGYLLKGADQAEIVRAVAAVADGRGDLRAAGRHAGSSSSSPRLEPRPRREIVFHELTAREHEVLDLIAAGRSNADVAAALVLSPKTVRNHVSNIFTKLHVADRSAAIVRARERRARAPGRVLMTVPLERTTHTGWTAGPGRAGSRRGCCSCRERCTQTSSRRRSPRWRARPCGCRCTPRRRRRGLTLVGLLACTHAGPSGWAGSARSGSRCAVVGLVMTACVAYAEAFLLPVIAADTPEVFAWDGAESPLRGPFASPPEWPCCGWSGWSCSGSRCGGPGVVPARSGPDTRRRRGGLLVFGGPVRAVLGPLSTLALAAATAGSGWRCGRGPPDTNGVESPAPRPSDEAGGRRRAGRRRPAWDGPRPPRTASVRSAVRRHPLAAFLVFVFAITGVLAALPVPEAGRRPDREHRRGGGAGGDRDRGRRRTVRRPGSGFGGRCVGECLSAGARRRPARGCRACC